MLAVAYDPDKLIFPSWASSKLDGIRTLCINGTAVSRNLKPIPNNYIRNLIEHHSDVLDGYDGELLLADTTAPFNDVSSAIMSRDGEPDFVYVVFDHFGEPGKSYQERFIERDHSKLPYFVKVVQNHKVINDDEIVALESNYLEAGFEGLMLRRADGKDRYKFGRSTVNEGHLLKVKQFTDSEATVVGFMERLHNGNEAIKNALGHTERSSHKDNMVPMDTLGALVVDCEEFGQFQIGTGFDDATRQLIWDNREDCLGRSVKFKHQPAGAKEGGTVRFPVFLGFRHEDDC